jgi:hypothetical protein
MIACGGVMTPAELSRPPPSPFSNTTLPVNAFSTGAYHSVAGLVLVTFWLIRLLMPVTLKSGLKVKNIDFGLNHGRKSGAREELRPALSAGFLIFQGLFGGD